jgi:predicted DNA-binding transcriptional regulator AlpA
MGRRLRADVDQRQLGLFGESLALGQKPKVEKALPVRPSQRPKPMAFHKPSTGSANVAPVPRRSLSSLPSEVVRPAEAALVLSVSLSLLKKWRAEGAGPRFVRLGGRAIGYRRADLSDWIVAQIR